ncbi:mycothiol conjugate amidase Mca [Mobilicoccus caccae]|uniref:Mycothiol S-conjugate amidase n=1 Tax=Mobilicoccus caccae TaxID=1859295 RepID=A0ABQ6IVC2_9MICO|nr:mycothiol conjugate amidase Mca [Mobilicoccus caccae]GMA40664.1 mycothiol S-conjugate amidase [Mobilicoccus caccae]
MTETFRLLAVHAHPDDESSKGAATMARYRSEGVRVQVVSCTGGERGDVLNPRLIDDPDVERDLPAFRRREMARAQQILDVEHTWLGFVDSGLPQGDPRPALPAGCFALEPVDITAEALVRVIREFRPHVVTTYDEVGGYPHPDHIMTHVVSVAAFRAAGDPDAYPHAGPAWQPLKLYYNQTIGIERITAFHGVMTERGMDSPFGEWLERWADRTPRKVTTRVQCGEFFEQRNAALLAHATQIDPDSWWFGIPIDVEREVWPTEDFELAASYVPFAEGESDLFAGLGTPDEADALSESAVAGSAAPVIDDIVVNTEILDTLKGE